MTRFLANWEVETDVLLAEGTPYLRYDHPVGKYTVFLRNVPEERNELFYLSMQFIFDAPSLKESKDVGELLAREFLDYLTFASNLKLRLRNIRQIFNWEPGGSGMRDCLYFTPSSAHDGGPFEALQQSLLNAVGMLQLHPIEPRLRRALKWFGNGVAARAPDDQFAFFWFVIELVAQHIKQPVPVPDRCPTCHGPLYCETCAATPLHRPYPKQAVHQLFQRYVAPQKEPEHFYKHASDARNMLMHGDEVKSIEAALSIEFPDLVDDMGHLAWIALLNQFVPALVGKQPMFLNVNHYVHMTLTGHAVAQVGFLPNFDNPDPAGFPDLKVSFTRERRKPSAQLPPKQDGQ